MKREMEKEREGAAGRHGDAADDKRVRFLYFLSLSLQNKVLTVDGVKVKLQVRSFTFFKGSERLLLLQKAPVFPP